MTQDVKDAVLVGEIMQILKEWPSPRGYRGVILTHWLNLVKLMMKGEVQHLPQRGKAPHVVEQLHKLAELAGRIQHGSKTQKALFQQMLRGVCLKYLIGHLETYEQAKELVRLLVKAEADPNHRYDQDENSLLHLLAASPETPQWMRISLHEPEWHLELIKTLVDCGADVNCLNRHGETPLFLVAKAGNTAIAHFLLESGCRIDHRDNYDATALHWACHVGFDPSYYGKENHTPVKALRWGKDLPQFARFRRSWMKSLGVVGVLLDHGADIFVRNKHGSTPLFLAAAAGHTSIVDALIAVGADCCTSTITGETPRDVANANGHSAVVALIDNALATRSARLTELRAELARKALEQIIEDIGKESDLGESCFVSYARGNRCHEDWVMRLAEHVRLAGFDVMLDQWQGRLFHSVSAFTDAIAHTKYVLVIGTPEYRQKYIDETVSHVVPDEVRLINGRLRDPARRRTVVPLLLNGSSREAFPEGLWDSVYIDMLGSSDFNVYSDRFFDLLERLRSNPQYEAPIVVQHRRRFMLEIEGLANFPDEDVLRFGATLHRIEMEQRQASREAIDQLMKQVVATKEEH